MLSYINALLGDILRFSLYLTMGMLLFGAEGKTDKELRTAMRLPPGSGLNITRLM